MDHMDGFCDFCLNNMRAGNENCYNCHSVFTPEEHKKYAEV